MEGLSSRKNLTSELVLVNLTSKVNYLFLDMSELTNSPKAPVPHPDIDAEYMGEGVLPATIVAAILVCLAISGFTKDEAKKVLELSNVTVSDPFLQSGEISVDTARGMDLPAKKEEEDPRDVLRGSDPANITDRVRLKEPVFSLIKNQRCPTPHPPRQGIRTKGARNRG